MQNIKIIAGHKITLEAGKRYLASRPMAAGSPRLVFPVTITDMGNGNSVLTIDNLSYSQANQLINAFNNGKISFDGRIW